MCQNGWNARLGHNAVYDSLMTHLFFLSTVMDKNLLRSLCLLFVWAFLSCTLPAQQEGTQNRLQLAGRYMQAGEAEKALSLYAELYEEDPQIFVYEAYVDCLQSLGRYDQAEKIIRKQMRDGVQPLLYQVDLAQNFLLSGQEKKAQAVFDGMLADWDMFGLSAVPVDELVKNIVEKTRRYDWAVSVYQYVRAATCDFLSAYFDGTPLKYRVNRDLLKQCGNETVAYRRVLDAASLHPEVMAWAEETALPGSMGKSTFECPPVYAGELAALYRLSGRYEDMLEEYLSDLYLNPGHQDEVYAALQAVLASPSVSNPSSSPSSLVSGREPIPASSTSSFSSESRKLASRLEKILYRHVQEMPDNIRVQDMLVWLLLQQEDFEAALLQARSYIRRFEDGGRKWLETIRIVASNRHYELAGKEYEAFISMLGSASSGIDPALARSAKIDLLNLYFTRLESQKDKDPALVERLKQSYKALFAELGRDPETFGMYRNLAKIYAYYAGDRDSSQLLLEQALASRRFPARQQAQLKLDLADILLYYDKVWDAMLLYAQVEKDFKQDPVGFYAKLQNARLSYYIGEFEWAKSQLEVLRAATAKLIANDAMELSLLIKENMSPDSTYTGLYYVARSDFMALRKLYEPALQLLDTLLAMPQEGGLFDEAYYRKAKIYLAMDSVDAALYWLGKVYTDYTDELLVDDALFMAAGLLQLRAGIPIAEGTEYSGDAVLPEAGSVLFGKRSEEERLADKEGAMRLYQRLFMDFRTSALASLARQRYRALRGDIM